MLIAGVAGGAVACATMVVPRRRLAPTGLTGLVMAVALVLASARIWHSTTRPDVMIASAFIALGAFGGGYALASSLIPQLTRPRTTAPTIPVAEGGDARLYVVLLSDAEPEAYDPRAVTAAFGRYEAAGVALPPDVARPLVYASERSRYHHAGGSPARDEVRAVARDVETRLVADGTADGVGVAFCSGDPSLAEAVADLAATGVHRIVVAGLTVAWTHAFETAVSDVQRQAASAAGPVLEVTDPMWASSHIAAMIARRTLSALGPEVNEDGVVLVSEGEPWQSGRDDPAAAEQTTFFTQRVRAELVDAGLAADRIRSAWLEWEEPDVAEAIRHLGALGARRVALVPVTFPVETIPTLVDLRFAAERAAGETGVVATVLDAWGNDPAVVQSLVEAIETALARLQG
jgi:protoheme ferro-lyase